MSRARSGSLALALVLASGAAGCTTHVNSVELSLRTSRGPVPLLCREGTAPLGGPMMMGMMGMPGRDAGAYLIARARTAGSARVVLDYFGITGGVPGCMADNFIDHCSRNCCPALPAQRVCVDVPLANAASRTDRQLADDILSGVHGRLASSDAPDGYVYVRVVVTTETCAELEPVDGGARPEFDSEQLVGCAYSCPVVLDQVQGTLSLGLPALGEQCGAVVDSCAHEFDRLAISGCAAAAGR